MGQLKRLAGALPILLASRRLNTFATRLIFLLVVFKTIGRDTPKKFIDLLERPHLKYLKKLDMELPRSSMGFHDNRTDWNDDKESEEVMQREMELAESLLDWLRSLKVRYPCCNLILYKLSSCAFKACEGTAEICSAGGTLPKIRRFAFTSQDV